jgi:hypothetical protein
MELPPNSEICLTSRGLITVSSTSSTILIALPSVTRRPLTNFALRPASRMRSVMALPPPWTRIGLMPTASRKTMSRSSRSITCSSSIALPPYLITKVRPRNFWINGSASISASALWTGDV